MAAIETKRRSKFWMRAVGVRKGGDLTPWKWVRIARNGCRSAAAVSRGCRNGEENGEAVALEKRGRCALPNYALDRTTAAAALVSDFGSVVEGQAAVVMVANCAPDHRPRCLGRSSPESA